MASNLFATARTSRFGLLGPALFMAALLIASGARAQTVAAPAPRTFTPAELQTLVGPIALYVDDLIGIVLPASAYPLQVVQAARFLDERATNPSLVPDAYWDDSVVALLNYPDVLRMMDQNLDWTSNLGEAFVYQQAELLDAIQQFRVLAQSAGNLPSNSYQTVAENNGAITITPANPQVIYVPYYEPARVVTYYSTPVVRYYPYGYPVYDYPYPAGYSFSSGFFWGVTTAFVLNWHSHWVNVYPYHYASHPYYGYRYYDSYYVRRYPSRNYYHHDDHHDNVWRPNDRWGSHPARYEDRRDRYTQTYRPVSTPDRHTPYTHADRQVQTPDRRGQDTRDGHPGSTPNRYGSSSTPAVASTPTNPSRTQWNSSHDGQARSPVTNGGNRPNAQGSGYRTPATTTAQRSPATGTRSIQRTPLKPPQTARVTPAPSRPTASNAPPRVASVPSRPATPAVRTQPVRTAPVPAAAPRSPATTVNRAPAASQRAPAHPPRAAAPAGSNNSRPPKASATPAPARQAAKQDTARQSHNAR